MKEIMEARVKTAASMDCDGIEPDNMMVRGVLRRGHTSRPKVSTPTGVLQQGQHVEDKLYLSFRGDPTDRLSNTVLEGRFAVLPVFT